MNKTNVPQKKLKLEKFLCVPIHLLVIFPFFGLSEAAE